MLFKDKLADKFLFACYLKREFDLKADVEDIQNSFYDYIIYEKKKKQESNLIWRLTILLYIITVLLVLLCFPFQYLFTGSWGLMRDKNIGKILHNWKEKL